MNTVAPKISSLKLLIQADFITQWRNRRSLIITFILPALILYLFKAEDHKLPVAIATGLMVTGIMGFPNSIAREREKGIFQRLRITPIPSWMIFVSKLMVQFAMLFLLITILIILNTLLYHIKLPIISYLSIYTLSLISGILYLSIGQFIVSLISKAETINAVAIFTLIATVVLNGLSKSGVLGNTFQSIWKWSPFATVQIILMDCMHQNSWNTHDAECLAITFIYILFFITIGIKKFKWTC